MAEERDIRARLEVETEGSFAEPRQDLEKLAKAAADAEERLHGLLRTANDVGIALGGSMRQAGVEVAALSSRVDQLLSRLQRAVQLAAQLQGGGPQAPPPETT